VDDNGVVTIAAVGGEAMEKARARVEELTAEPVVGETYEGVVKSTTAFGAFIEIMPGTEGLLHISEMRHGRTERTEDVVKKGDRVKVKLIERDDRGKMRLSMKALLPKPTGEEGGAGASSEEEGEVVGVGSGSREHRRGDDSGRRPRRGGGGGGRSRGRGGRGDRE
jgi:polyribonucleotide nucleotidyltransferase